MENLSAFDEIDLSRMLIEQVVLLIKPSIGIFHHIDKLCFLFQLQTDTQLTLQAYLKLYFCKIQSAGLAYLKSLRTSY